jgi:hypothetical protein
MFAENQRQVNQHTRHDRQQSHGNSICGYGLCSPSSVRRGRFMRIKRVRSYWWKVHWIRNYYDHGQVKHRNTITPGTIIRISNKVRAIHDFAWIAIDTTAWCHGQIPEPKNWLQKQLLPTALPTPLNRMAVGQLYGHNNGSGEIQSRYLGSSRLTWYEKSQKVANQGLRRHIIRNQYVLGVKGSTRKTPWRGHPQGIPHISTPVQLSNRGNSTTAPSLRS